MTDSKQSAEIIILATRRKPTPPKQDASWEDYNRQSPWRDDDSA